MRELLPALCRGEKLSTRNQIYLTLQLSIPAILAQLSTIIMQYIDTGMVGSLGAQASASIGLVSPCTWFLNGLYLAVIVGFTVPVAQNIGAGNEKSARDFVRQGMLVGVLFSLVLAIVGALCAPHIPVWLQADEALHFGASTYFMVFSLTVPIQTLNRLASGMLQASGNMKTPSRLMILMCALDVVFNQFLIFPSHTLAGIPLPGAGLGVMGAALGTALSELVTMILMMVKLLVLSPALHLRRSERLTLRPLQLRQSVLLSLPVAAERTIINVAQIVTMRIIAPLGAVAIAANSFAVTVEGVCYMPGYGVQSAATTLIGQAVGAKRKDLLKRLSWVTVLLGMAIMFLAAIILFFAAPWIISLMTPDPQVVALGTRVLRIVLLSEPMFGASIVAAGVFRGANNSLVSSILGLCSMWGIRIPLSLHLVGAYGLQGAWIAMSIELICRGAMFIFVLWRGRWIPRDIMLWNRVV